MRGRKREAASRTSQPASREGEHGRGAKAGHRKRQKGPRLEVSVQPDGKSWRLRNRQSQAQRQRLGEEVGKGTGANEGIRHLEQISGHRKLKRGWGYKGMERAMALGALLGGASIHLNTPNIQKGTYILAIGAAPTPTCLAYFSSVRPKCFQRRAPSPRQEAHPPTPASGAQDPDARSPPIFCPIALALPALGNCCSSEVPRAALGRGPPGSPTLRGERWAWPTTPWTASRWDKFLSATCTSSGAFTWLGRWAGLCSRGGVSSSW